MRTRVLKNISATTLIIAAVLMQACTKNVEPSSTPNNNTVASSDKIAPDGFNFSTVAPLNIHVRVMSADNKPLSNTVVNFYNYDNGTANRSVLTAVTNSDGFITTSVQLPSFVDSLTVSPANSNSQTNIAVNGSALNTTMGTTTFALIKPLDSDGDGIPDVYDEYPYDAARAYNNYYPSKDVFGTIAFEDMWPTQGDYDMNDLVVSYNYKYVTDANNKVVEVFGTFAPIASGANFGNGFGIQFPFAQGLVKRVTGQKLKNNFIQLNSNGTETGNINAVIIPFDNAKDLINNWDGNIFVNTLNTRDKVSGDTANVYVEFNAPMDITTFGTAPFNPFLISNGNRGVEVHLPNMLPTDRANKLLLGKLDDASIPSLNIYYITKDNHPFALNFAEPFSYPLETINIADAYKHFLNWAISGGNTDKDWYKQNNPGFRDNSKIYLK